MGAKKRIFDYYIKFVRMLILLYVFWVILMLVGILPRQPFEQMGLPIKGISSILMNLLGKYSGIYQFLLRVMCYCFVFCLYGILIGCKSRPKISVGYWVATVFIGLDFLLTLSLIVTGTTSIGTPLESATHPAYLIPIPEYAMVTLTPWIYVSAVVDAVLLSVYLPRIGVLFGRTGLCEPS